MRKEIKHIARAMLSNGMRARNASYWRAGYARENNNSIRNQLINLIHKYADSLVETRETMQFDDMKVSIEIKIYQRNKEKWVYMQIVARDGLTFEHISAMEQVS